jgi:hypothetical protein
MNDRVSRPRFPPNAVVTQLWRTIRPPGSTGTARRSAIPKIVLRSEALEKTGPERKRGLRRPKRDSPALASPGLDDDAVAGYLARLRARGSQLLIEQEQVVDKQRQR